MGLLLLNLVASLSHSISLAGFANKQEITAQMFRWAFQTLSIHLPMINITQGRGNPPRATRRSGETVPLLASSGVIVGSVCF